MKSHCILTVKEKNYFATLKVFFIFISFPFSHLYLSINVF